MTRALVLGLVVGVGALSMTVSAAFQASPQALTVDKINDRLYVIKGGGGNTGVFLTANGVVVIDAKNPGYGAPILAKIQEITSKPVTTLINTHSHGDHVSGNVEFPATVEVIVQDNTKANMEKMPIFATSKGVGLPKKSFKDKMTVGKGADQIDLFYFGPGHTGGDAVVVFPALHVAHIGDLFAGKGLPLIDGATGGSQLHYPDTLEKAVAGIKNVDTLINGHSNTTTTFDDLKTFAQFNREFVTWAQAGLKAGKTPEQLATEWKLPEKYTGYSATAPTMFGGMAGRIQLLADEMKK